MDLVVVSAVAFQHQLVGAGLGFEVVTGLEGELQGALGVLLLDFDRGGFLEEGEAPGRHREIALHFLAVLHRDRNLQGFAHCDGEFVFLCGEAKWGWPNS